jgi:hypothetical protein
MSPTSSASLLLVAAITTGCNAFQDIPEWLGTRDPQPILHASLPRALSQGGGVLASPQVVPIFFAGDRFQSDVERLLSELPRSKYWSATTSEYGVGKLRIARSVVVDEPPPASDDFTDVEPWLARHLESATPEWPAPSRENVYVVFYPETANGTSCPRGAYHSEGFQGVTTPGGTQDAGARSSVDAGRGASFAYEVVPECRQDEGLATLDVVTWRLSYQLIRTVTDPFVVTSPAFDWVGVSHLAWSFFEDSEAGPTGYAELTDLCYLEAGPQSTMRLDGEFEVARSWSNAAASQQQDPCVPSTDEPYFGAAPDLTEVVPVQLYRGEPIDTYGVRVPLHESRIVDVRLFATRARSDFHVFAEEIPFAEDDAPTLRFEWDRQRGNDHEFLHLTITRLRNGPLGGTQIRVTSGETDTANWTHGWMGFVAN